VLIMAGAVCIVDITIAIRGEPFEKRRANGSGPVRSNNQSLVVD